MRFALIILCSLAVLELSPARADSIPNGAQLLNSCDHALAHGFGGIEGKMCQWYVTPCECTALQPGVPRVCLPEDAKPKDLAELVVKGLRAEPKLKDQSATMAANTILARRYPCAEEE